MTRQGKIWRKTGKAGALALGAAASLFALSPAASSIPLQPAKEPPSRAGTSIEQRARFTPARGDKRLAASLARDSKERRTISFTPAGPDPQKDKVRVALRGETGAETRGPAGDMRAVAGAPAARLGSDSYNLGVAVGWKRFSLSGDVSETRSRLPALEDRERAALGVSYNRESFSAGAKVSGERKDSPAPAVGPRESYALDVGGQINVSKHIAVTGGVRYRIDQERIDPALDDSRRDSQAVYVGTALRF